MRGEFSGDEDFGGGQNFGDRWYFMLYFFTRIGNMSGRFWGLVFYLVGHVRV
jgi:hypothetical protein